MSLFIGIDGGGSKTVALVAGPDGAILGRGTAGASNYQGVGLAAAQAAVSEAVEAAFAAAGLAGRTAAAVCVGLAGAGRAEDQAAFGSWLAQRWPGAVYRVANDAELVLASGSEAGWGLAVIAGTGSIAYGRDAQGRTARAGGWGPLLGDEGSGYAIGRAALRAAIASYDGSAAATALLPAILTHFEIDDATALVGLAYRPPLAAAEIAALAALVEQAAADGDAVAAALLDKAGRDLALTAAAVARRLGFVGAVPCAVAGSVLVKGQRVFDAFARALGEAGVSAQPLARVAEPAAGATRLARELLGVDRTAQ